MQLFFFVCLVGFLLAVDCSVKNEVECGLAYPDCTFFVNNQSCETDYCSFMTEGLCLHGYPGCFWDNGCRTDPCVYWNPFDDNTSNPCNETYCMWKAYHNVKFHGSTGEPQFVESYQCINKTQHKDNPCYLLGPIQFNPPTEYYCEYFPECELAIVLDDYGDYEMCDPKMDKECDELGVDNCNSESPSCFLNNGKCVLDTCLQYSSNSFCPAGCLKKAFHDMTLLDGKAYYSEITQCVNDSAPDDYNACYLIRPGYCDHYDDCEEKTVSHIDHGHLICNSKAKGSEQENGDSSKGDSESGKTNVAVIALLVVVIVVIVAATVVLSMLIVWRTSSQKESQVVATPLDEMSESHKMSGPKSRMAEDVSEVEAELE